MASSVMYFPAEQLMHGVVAEEKYFPAEQMLQEMLSCRANFLASQSSQASSEVPAEELWKK